MRIDCHLHFYPVYQLAPALTHLVRALAPDPQVPGLGVMAERSDCRYFQSWYESGRQQIGALVVEPSGALLRISNAAGHRVYLAPGRQIATDERLEVIAPGADEPIPDGLSLAETLQTVQATGGLAVLAWAPGKWLGGRGRNVAEALQADHRILPADSSMRPYGWPAPAVFRQAGDRLLAGSDPLPFRGEETWWGRYYLNVDGTLPDAPSLADVKRILSAGGRPGGMRSLPWQWCLRMARLQM